MHKITVKFPKAYGKNPSFDYSKIECLFLPNSDFAGALRKRSWLTPEIDKQVQKKLVAIKESEDAGKDKTKKAAPKKSDPLKTPSFDTFRVAFSQGGEAILFALPTENFSLFELHTALRKTFSGFFSKGAKHSFVLDFLELNAKSVTQQLQIVEAFGHLSESGDWKPTAYGKRTEAKNIHKELHFEFVSKLATKQLEPAFHTGQVKARACNQIRTLSEMPPNKLNPKGYKTHIQAFAKEHGLKYEFFDTAKLTKLGANAFLAVVRADPSTESGIAKVTYKPKGSIKKKIALVGKGVCFDTGGYNIKTGDHMLGMHGDMGGSAIVLAMLEAFKELNLPFEVTSYLVLAENLISPSGFKPNEVVIAMNGMSIEVVDTDAEGRMILSDALVLASREKPDLLLDYATLTGSVIRCLDRRRSGIYTNEMKFLPMAMDAGDASGERVWGFPIGRDYLEVLNSEVADIKQCNPAWNGDHIYASTFLSRFVEAGVPWFHMDLAACENKGGLGLVTTDNTGFGVGWTLSFVDRFFRRA